MDELFSYKAIAIRFYRRVFSLPVSKIAPQPSGIESEVILQMRDMSLVSVHHFLPGSTINKMEIILTDVLSPDLTLSR